MWKILLSLLVYTPVLAAPQGPIIWGNNNNAVYLPTNRPTIGSYCLTVDPLGVISPQTCSGGAGSGTVTSVDWGVLPSWLTGLGGPITTSGTLGLAIAAQPANLFLASPNGVAGTITPRAIVAADIPQLNQNTTGSAASLSTVFATGQPLVGDGTGLPVIAAKSGNTTQFATVAGVLVPGNSVIVDVNGNLIDGSPSGGTTVTPISGNYAAIIPGEFILANCAVLCTVTLPNIAALNGYKVSMKNIGVAHAVFQNVVGQLIDGQIDWDLFPDKSHVNLISSGGQWYVY